MIDAPTQQPNLFTRGLDAIGRHARGFTIANLIAQGGIIVTGGLVRLTDSGLGCSVAPQCEPGEFWPDLSHLSVHTAVEFGNRVITMFVMVAALLTAIAVWRTRRDLRWFALLPLAGVFVQAVLGAVTVNLDLKAMVVAVHMWVSVALVGLSTVLALRYRDAPARLGKQLALLRFALAGLAGIIVILGTLTTASGPHSGDKDITQRLSFLPLEDITRAHSVAVWIFLLLLAFAIWQIRHDRSDADIDEVRKAWIVLVGVVAVQGAIGYTQYFMGLPEWVIALHLAGVATFTAAVAAFIFLVRPVTNR